MKNVNFKLKDKINELQKLKQDIESAMIRRCEIKVKIEKLQAESRDLSAVISYAEDRIDKLELEIQKERSRRENVLKEEAKVIAEINDISQIKEKLIKKNRNFI